MGPIGCAETSVRIYHYSLINNPEERCSLLICMLTSQKHRIGTFGRRSRRAQHKQLIERFVTSQGQAKLISDVFLTVHHSIDFSNYQLNTQFFYFSTICMLHYAPQHVSSSTLLILRRTNCIITASGIVALCKQPYSMQVESGLQSAPPAYCTAVVIQLVLLRMSSVLLETC